MSGAGASIHLNAFVIMPFKGDVDNEIYTLCVRPTVEAAGFKCHRSDEHLMTVDVVGDVLRSITSADVVIAELTGQRANVFYELAFAHTMRRPTIMIARSAEDLPFNLSRYQAIFYSNSAAGIEFLKNQLRGFLDAFKYGAPEFRNPVMDHMPDSPFMSVMRTKEVLAHEAGATERVCVLAPDISLGPGYFKDVMKENIARGIRYQYLVPDTPALISQLDEFLASLKLGDKRSLFSMRATNPDYIESDVTLIDPGTPNERGIILAPAEKANFHYSLVASALYRMKTRFEKLWFAANKQH